MDNSEWVKSLPWSCRVTWGLCIQNPTPIEQKNILCHIFFRYVHQTYTVNFSIISTIMKTKSNHSIANITKVSLLGYGIYYSAGAVCISWGINSIAKWAISINNSDRKMQAGSLDGGVNGEYNSVGLMEMSGIFMTQDDFFLCSRTVWQKVCVGFIPDNADELNWNVITGSCLSRHEINHEGHVSLS